MCRYGHSVVRQIFEESNSESLKGFVVFIPMLEGDEKNSARRQSSTIDDKRVVQVWDLGLRLGDLVAESLQLTDTAWDIYLVFSSGTKWKGDVPPQPDFWMHQLPPDYGVGGAPSLEPRRLSREVEKQLARMLPPTLT